MIHHPQFFSRFNDGSFRFTQFTKVTTVGDTPILNFHESGRNGNLDRDSRAPGCWLVANKGV